MPSTPSTPDNLRLTAEMIEACRTPKGAFTRRSVELLGASWPPPKGWRREIIGKEIDRRSFEEAKAAGKKTPASGAPQRELALPDTEGLKEVIVTTDGGCWPNPGIGGWAAILRFGPACKEISGSSAETTTNNRMEFAAVIEALSLLKYRCKVTLRSDSMLVVNAMNGLTKDKAIKKNRDLVLEARRLGAIHHLTAIFVRGHNGDPDNERCDQLAQLAAAPFQISPAEVPKPLPTK